jgi:iron complex transport system substrate-binding protein
VKRHSVILFAALLAAVPAASAGPLVHTVTDAGGQVVSVPAQPQRILSLCTTVTDTLLRLGQKERLAGIDEFSRIVPGATNLPVLGKGSALSREQVLARQVDLAFIWWYQDDAARMLEELRVPVVRIRCGRAEEVPATIQLVGDCLGLADAASELGSSVSARLVRLRQSAGTNGPRVYVELYSPFKTSGRESYLNDLIELAGGRNVAGEAAGPVLFSVERLLQSDPEIVLLIDGFGTPEQFARRGGLENLSAVKTGRVYPIDRYCLVAGAALPEDVTNLRRLFNSHTQTNP